MTKLRWTPADINWAAFEPGHVDPELLKAVKAAALVEFNSPDYVSYLCNVFDDAPQYHDEFRQWGVEEGQHGRVLARWAKLADPDFDFDGAFARFRKIQAIDTSAIASVRGSRAGEMIARCVVESGTSSFYTAIKDATEEPLLKQIATYLAADEFAHYRLFYERFKTYEGELPTVLQRLRIAVGRVNEADDDELSGAYFCANYPEGGPVTYDRKTFAAAYQARALGVYRRQHIDRLLSMVAKAGGLKPQGPLVRTICAIAWPLLSWQQKRLEKRAV